MRRDGLWLACLLRVREVQGTIPGPARYYHYVAVGTLLTHNFLERRSDVVLKM